MICILALVVFGIMGIFSATHRKLAKEAFDCVFRKITFRKCHTGLDSRIKSGITGRILKFSPSIGNFTFKHFESISWIFTIIMIWSVVAVAIGGYNFYVYGNCNGPVENPGFCIFDPQGKNDVTGIGFKYDGPFVYPRIDDDPSLGNNNSKVEIIEFGCFLCPYTKKAEATVKQIISDYGDKVHYVYRDFPLNERHQGSDLHAEAADCALEQGKYWEYHDLLFQNQNMTNHTTVMIELAQQIELNMTQFNACFESMKYKDEVQKDFEDGSKAKVFGTPTFFINGDKIVGPHDYQDFKKIIDKKIRETNES